MEQQDVRCVGVARVFVEVMAWLPGVVETRLDEVAHRVRALSST